MRCEPVIRIALTLCAVLGLVGQAVGVAGSGVAARVSLCSGGTIDLPLDKGRSSPGRHGDPCSLACHVGNLSRRRLG